MDEGVRAGNTGLRSRQGEAIALVCLAPAYGVVEGLLADGFHGDGQRHRVIAPIVVGDSHGVFDRLFRRYSDYGGGVSSVPQIRKSLAGCRIQGNRGAFTDYILQGVDGDCGQPRGGKVQGDHAVTTRGVGEGMLVTSATRETYMLVPVEAAARHGVSVAGTVLEYGHLMDDGVSASVSGANHFVIGGIFWRDRDAATRN